MREYRVSRYRAFSSRPTVEVHTDGKLAHSLAHQWTSEAMGRTAVVEHREVGAWFEAVTFESEGHGMMPAAGQGTDAQTEGSVDR